MLFQPLVSKFGTTEVQLSQHLVVTYVKVDGSKGTKMEQVDSILPILSIVDLLDQRVFGKYHQQPFITHKLKMLLGSKMRQAGAELGQAQNKICLLGKLMLSSSIEVVFHWFDLSLRLFSIQVVSYWGYPPFIFYWVCLQLSLSSIEVVFHRGCIP